MRNKFNQIPKPKPKVKVGVVVNPAVANKTADLLQQGLALHKAGQLEQASVIYEEILKLNPKHFDANHLNGVIFFQNKNYLKAIETIKLAISINSSHPSAHSNLEKAYIDFGNLKFKLGELNEAINCYSQALLINKKDIIFYNRGLVYKQINQIDLAISDYKQAIKINNNYFEAYSDLGIALKEIGNLDEALENYNKSIAINDSYINAYYNRGNVLKELKRLDEALTSYDRAIELKRDYAEAYYNRGIVLNELKRLDEALTSYDRAIELKSDYAEAYSNRGAVLKELKQLDQALTSYDRAIAIKPDYAEAYWNKSLALLLGGDFDKGFNEYEWRWKKDNLTSPKRNFSQPLWLDAKDIAGKTILLHAEQGLGDTLQFCRYVMQVAELGAKVILEVQKPLVNLLQNLTGVSQLVAKGSALPEFDYQCPLMSLPLAFKTELNSIPSSTAYLKNNAAKLEVWSKRLGEKSKPRIGLVWSGNSKHGNDHNRSLSLTDVLKHLQPNFEYVSLQKEVREGDKDALTNSAVKHYGDELNDFTDTAALCDLMDIVISVDTSVAHLAGALGKTTWILLPYVPDWRWLLDRDDSPWYASVKLYRQDEDRQYAPVLERIANDLMKEFV